MQPLNQHSRVNLVELKAQLVKKLGQEGSKQYFNYLQKFLSLKLSKVEFDKLCLRILGRENIRLHNQLICSILRNACSAKAPPPVSETDDILNNGTKVVGKEILDDGCQQNGIHFGTNQASGSKGLLNGGDMLPASPRRLRTGLRDRRNGERRSGLGPNVKSSCPSHLSNGSGTQLSNFSPVTENGELTTPNIGRPIQHHKGLLPQAGIENDNLVSHASKLPIARMSTSDSAPVDSKGQHELLDKNEMKGASSRSPLQAPLELPLCPASIGGACTAPPPSRSSRFIGTCCDDALLDSLALRERMENIAVAHGLEGVPVECANMLNHGLDSYLRGLIRSCFGVVGSRSRDMTKNNFHKQQIHMKQINGVKPGHQLQMPNCSADLVVEEPICRPISLQDFKVAMELKPHQLGEDWPLLLEKICTHAFEEEYGS